MSRLRGGNFSKLSTTYGFPFSTFHSVPPGDCTATTMRVALCLCALAAVGVAAQPVISLDLEEAGGPFACCFAERLLAWLVGAQLQVPIVPLPLGVVAARRQAGGEPAPEIQIISRLTQLPLCPTTRRRGSQSVSFYTSRPPFFS